MKSQNKPCKNNLNCAKGHGCRDLARETGLDKDNIHIFFSYLSICPLVYSFLCDSSVEISARYLAMHFFPKPEMISFFEASYRHCADGAWDGKSEKPCISTVPVKYLINSESELSN
jgi:hypothetical protein